MRVEWLQNALMEPVRRCSILHIETPRNGSKHHSTFFSSCSDVILSFLENGVTISVEVTLMLLCVLAQQSELKEDL